MWSSACQTRSELPPPHGTGIMFPPGGMYFLYISVAKNGYMTWPVSLSHDGSIWSRLGSTHTTAAKAAIHLITGLRRRSASQSVSITATSTSVYTAARSSMMRLKTGSLYRSLYGNQIPVGFPTMNRVGPSTQRTLIAVAAAKNRDSRPRRCDQSQAAAIRISGTPIYAFSPML